MLKKAILVWLSIFLMFSSLSLPVVNAATADNTEYDSVTVMKIMNKTSVTELQAKGAVLIDCNTGSILQEKNGNEKLPIASVTKVMSMLLIMEAIDSGKLSFDTKVTISDNSYRMGGTQVWLEPREVFTVHELLQAVSIRSANDATVALAEAVAGSEDAFVALMNERAKELGMKNTNFLDSTGLTDIGHYSSAYDVALMSRELLLNHPGITKYTTPWQAKFRENTPGRKPVLLDNTNKLVKFYEGAVGLKTGYTAVSGHCLSASAVRNGQQLIAVVLGEPDSNTRFAEARKLLDYGFANFETTLVNNKGEEVQQVQVKKGLQQYTNAVYKQDVKLLLKKGEKGKVERIINLENNLSAPVSQGQKIGEIIYMISGNEVGNAELVASNSVQKASFIKLFLLMMREWFVLGRAI